LPRKTTTRVSSGWVASMSILLAIAYLVKAGVPQAPRRSGDGGRRAAHLSMKETDRKLRARQTDIAPVAGERRMNAAVPIRSNLSRLEHELQTVVNGSVVSRRD
jgi:hypothetical protein